MVRPGAILLTIRRGPDDSARDVEAEVLQVLGPHGGPPFLVRWVDDGSVGLFGPDDDAYLQRQGPARPVPDDAVIWLLGNRA